jgi:hypothetical protein
VHLFFPEVGTVKRQLALFLYKVEFVMFIEVHGRSFDFVMNFMFECLRNGSMCGLQSDAESNVLILLRP